MAGPWDAAFLRGAIKGGAGVGGAFKGYSSAMMRRQQGGDDAAKKALLAQLDQAVRAAVAQNQGLPLDAGAQQEILAGFPALQGADLNYLYTQGLFGKPEAPEAPAKMTPYQAFEVHKALGGGKQKEKTPAEIEGESLDLDYKRLRNEKLRAGETLPEGSPDQWSDEDLLEWQQKLAPKQDTVRGEGGKPVTRNLFDPGTQRVYTMVTQEINRRRGIFDWGFGPYKQADPFLPTAASTAADRPAGYRPAPKQAQVRTYNPATGKFE